MRLRFLLPATALAITATACAGGGDPVARSVYTLPPPLTSCREWNRGEAFDPCYDQLAEYLRAETILAADGQPPTRFHFGRAVDRIVPDLVPRFGGYFTNDSPLGDVDEEAVSTEPVRTQWSIGGDPVTLWACFGGGTVTVVRDACPTVP